MSRFNSYAKKLEEMTFEAVNQIKDAEEKYRKATDDHQAMPIRSGFVEANYSIESQRRQLAYDEARQNLNAIRKDIPNRFEREAKELRKKLSDELYDYFAVKPDLLSPETMSLLKLMKAAISDNNITMIRMIASKAADIAKDTDKTDTRVFLKTIASKADNYTPETYLNAFDSFISVSERCMKNTRLIDSWNQIGMPEVVKSF